MKNNESTKLNIFKVFKTVERLDTMLENAINGIEIDEIYDEYMISSLEVKMNNFIRSKLDESKQLEKQKYQVEQLISDISHQTKTPIANLLLYSDLLKEQQLDECCVPLVEQIARQSEHLNFLIQSMIKSSQLENGTISVKPTSNSVNKLVQTIVSQAKAKADAKQITISADSNDIYALFDMKWTVEALSNIVDNAIKYTKFKGGIEIKTTSYESFCRIDVSDNGVGIDESEHSRIFARFYRSVKTSCEEGVGIGLFLSREIIEKQSGYIKLSSAIGKGSTFSVFLPNVKYH